MRPPNLVVLLADDAGWGDYSASGNRTVQTPHIDSLSRDGATLERFFVCPVCAPTRAEFLTGRYHPRTGVYGVSTGQERMDLSEKTIADAFQKAGYATGAFGKWHNGSQWPYHPMARGFGEYYGYTSGHWGEYFNPPLEHNGKPVRERGYIVDLCTDKALAFIEKNKSRPFFCYVPFTTPHSPWAVPESDWQRFKDKPLAQQATEPGKESPEQTRCALAMLENQDRNVGRILKKLEQLKLTDNTIVVYFSDNGPNTARWNGGMKGIKATTDEGGVRSVFFIRWPGKLPAGHQVPEIAGAIDLLPTLMALTKVTRVGDKPLDGRDLSPLLTGRATTAPPRVLFSTWSGRVSVRSQTHRLDASGELFDMVADPNQTCSVTAQQPDTARQLTSAVATWRTEMFSRSPRPASLVDPRPIPVGYKIFPRTWLPARDGTPGGAIERSSSAPNSSYFRNWTRTNDTISWEIEVNTAGAYDVELHYTCPLPDAGSRIVLSFQGSRLEGRVAPGWDPPLYTNQDTLPRPPGESRLKEFRILQLGKLRLERGRGPLALRALEIPGKEVMHLSAVVLTLR